MNPSIQVSCSRSNLAVIRDYVKSCLDAFSVTGKTAGQIVLAVDEACANCIIHQHNCDGSSQIEVSVEHEQGTVFIAIKDSGQAFPIDEYTPQALETIIQNRRKGGLGINLIHRIMDKIEVEQRDGYHLYKFQKRIDE